MTDLTPAALAECVRAGRRATARPWKYEEGAYDCDEHYGDPEQCGADCKYVYAVDPPECRGPFTLDCGEYMGMSDENAKYTAVAAALADVLALRELKAWAAEPCGNVPTTGIECAADNYPLCDSCEARAELAKLEEEADA